jgi:hypothetical protein
MQDKKDLKQGEGLLIDHEIFGEVYTELISNLSLVCRSNGQALVDEIKVKPNLFAEV